MSLRDFVFQTLSEATGWERRKDLVGAEKEKRLSRDERRKQN